MSGVVTADIAQVLPDRTLVVRRSGSALEVSLTGLARLADSQPNRVFVLIERLDPDAAPDGVDLSSSASLIPTSPPGGESPTAR